MESAHREQSGTVASVLSSSSTSTTSQTPSALIAVPAGHTHAASDVAVSMYVISPSGQSSQESSLVEDL